LRILSSLSRKIVPTSVLARKLSTSLRDRAGLVVGEIDAELLEQHSIDDLEPL
jgi:hypothetical protein